MSGFFFEGEQKVTWIPYVEGETPTAAQLLGTDELSCDCGCEDIERAPAAEITYYADHEAMRQPEFLASPGVTSAWFLLDGEYVPFAIMSSGDGKGSVVRTDGRPWG